METDIPIVELVGKIKRKEITLPEIQRRYIWTKTIEKKAKPQEILILT